MIYGAKYWSDHSRYYSQENNPTEELLRKRQGEEGFLESCGPTSAVNCLAALGYNLKIYCPGTYKPQPEEILQDFFQDPRNYDELEKIRADVLNTYPGNRIPQFYPYAVQQVFNADGTFVWLSSFEKLAAYLKHGCTAQLCLVSPGHFIAAVAYDDETDEIIFNDSWPGRFADGNGFNRRLDIDEFNRNVKKYAIIYKELKYE